MAEAEDVITDVARHATVFARDLWRRHRTMPAAETVALAGISQRVDLLITAVFGSSYPIRIAQPPAPPTFLTKVFRRREGPRLRQAVPATDGVNIWLPYDSGIGDAALALERFRTVALQQAMRAHRGSARGLIDRPGPLLRDIYLLFEAYAADEALARLLPGTVASINSLRRAALATRPALSRFPEHRRPLEIFVRTLLQSECACPIGCCPQFVAPSGG